MNQEATQIYFQQGNQLIKEGKIDEAIASYRNAIAIEPKVALLHHRLGDALLTRGSLNEAVASHRKAVELQSEVSWFYYRLGQALAQQGNLDEAIVNLQTAMQLEPTLPGIYENLGNVLQQQGKFDEAFTCYLKAVQIEPNSIHEYYDQLSYSDLTINQLAAAISCLKEICQSRHDVPVIYTLLGNLLTKKNQIDAAISYYYTAMYKQTLVSHPDLVSKQWNLEQVRGPNFLIIGGMRCGTTSLYEYLTKHPQVVPALKKEVQFWSWEYAKGIDWYLAHFPPIPDGASFVTGEATPCMGSPYSWERLFEYFPKIKLIVILRNPIDRALSHYYHLQRCLGWDRRTFEAAIQSEMQIIKSIEDPSLVDQTFFDIEYGYLLSGLYVCFLEKWMNLFPREQFLILRSEDFYIDASVQMEKVFNFLDLPDYQLAHYEKYNLGAYTSMSESLRLNLSEFFQPYNQKLEEYLGMKFDWH
ncbi:MAG: tetratricopeptide repeat protein [bacterium]|nr:tetratricopeptide repeat protein [bacterium]